MKNKLNVFIIVCMILALLTACSSDLTDTPKNIRWYSLDDGLKVAREQDKKVILYFWAKW